MYAPHIVMGIDQHWLWLEHAPLPLHMELVFNKFVICAILESLLESELSFLFFFFEIESELSLILFRFDPRN